MAKSGEQYFVLTLPLKTEGWQRDVLETRFEINRQIYNALLQQALKQYRQMAQTRAYRANREALHRTESPEQRKLLYQERDRLVEQYQLRRYDICKEATKYRRHFKEHTDSPVTQNLANEVWQAVDGLIRGVSSRVYPKAHGQMRSLSGKTDRSSIRFRDNCMVWKGLTLPIARKEYSAYERQALEHELRYCRIKRSIIRGKRRYFIELILRGRAPVKQKIAGDAGGSVGLDIGFRRLALVTQGKAAIYELPKKNKSLEYQKKELSRYLDRSRRALNPGNYLSDGRIKKGSREWRFSQKYLRAKERYYELCRKQAVLQRQEQYKLIQEVISQGSCFYIEDLSFAKLKRIGFNGFNLTQTSPSGFLRILEYKADLHGKQFYRLSPFLVKASGFNHHTGACQKMPRRRSWRIVGGRKVDKGLYSAFLLSNLSRDLRSFDLEQCEHHYPAFLEAQDRCLCRKAS